MAAGPSAYLNGKVLDAIFNNSSFAVAQVYVGLHTADPGAAGTSNVIACTDNRKALSCGAASSSSVASDAAPSWTVTNTSDVAWISLWDAASSGNFLWAEQLTSTVTVPAGETFTIQTGDLTATCGAA